MDDEKAINLIKQAIQTEAGWANLVKSVKNNLESQTQLKRLLRTIGGDKQVNLSDIDGLEWAVDYGDILVHQLEMLIEKSGEK